MFHNLHKTSRLDSARTHPEHTSPDILDHPVVNPDELKQICTNVLKTHLQNYSEVLVKKLIHKEEIKSPDQLKQLSLYKFRLLLPGHSDAEFEMVRKIREINVPHGIEYPLSGNSSEYLHKLSLTHKSCVLVPRMNTEVIKLWTKSHWGQLDPYSDLDESSADTTSMTGESNVEPLGMNGGHYLCPRKKKL